MTPKPNRRKAKPLSDKKLYTLPQRSVDSFIDKERREDEKERLQDILEQKRVWRRTVCACALLNFTFLALAAVGYFTQG